MKPTHPSSTRWVAGLVALALLATGLWPPAPVGAERGRRPASPPPEVPIIGPTSWSDSLVDATGLSWLEHTRHMDGQISLSQFTELGEPVFEVWAIAEGPDGKLYVGADNAHLWSYDLDSGAMLDLGAPVPDECDT